MVHCISYNAFNVYRRELAPGTVSLTGDRAQGDDSKHWAHSREHTCERNNYCVYQLHNLVRRLGTCKMHNMQSGTRRKPFQQIWMEIPTNLTVSQL